MLVHRLRLNSGLTFDFAEGARASPPSGDLPHRSTNGIVSALDTQRVPPTTRPIASIRRRCPTCVQRRGPPVRRFSLPHRPLSRRETGILQMIAHGMSNKRIAQSLGITPETVKSHAKSIFVKLTTRTRAQAVARAEAIGFL